MSDIQFKCSKCGNTDKVPCKDGQDTLKITCAKCGFTDVYFRCPECGNAEFKVSSKDFRDTDRITCAKCGFTDTYRRIVGPQVKKMISDAMAKVYK